MRFDIVSSTYVEKLSECEHQLDEGFAMHKEIVQPLKNLIPNAG